MVCQAIKMTKQTLEQRLEPRKFDVSAEVIREMYSSYGALLWQLAQAFNDGRVNEVTDYYLLQFELSQTAGKDMDLIHRWAYVSTDAFFKMVYEHNKK